MRTSSNYIQSGILFCATVLVCPLIGVAAPRDTGPWRLLYSRATNAPDNCPDEEFLRISLAAAVDGQDRFTADAGRSISVEIAPTSSDIEARVVARDEAGNVTTSQTLHAPSWRCDQLADHIVFVLRDIVDPLELPPVKTRPVPDSHQIAKPDKPDFVEIKPRHAAPKVAPTPSPLIPKLAFPLSVGASWWTAPEAALSTTFGIEAQWKRVTLAFEARFDYAWTVPNVRSAQAERAGVVMAVCALRDFSKRFYFRGCGLIEIARLSLDVERVDLPDQNAPVVDLGARIGLGAELFPSLAVELRGDGSFFVTPSPRFVVNDGQVWRVPSLAGAIRAAFVGKFDVL